MIQPPVLTPMAPMQFAQAPAVNPQFAALGKSLQGLAPKPGVPPAGPAPMDISPGATNAGTNMPQPGILDALRGMSPQSILDKLRAMSAGGQQVVPPGMPGSAALDGAGMLTPPAAASGIPLSLIPGA